MGAYGVDRGSGAGGSGSSVTPIEANILDAKGDLVVASAADTPDNLTVGANKTRLVADSTQTLGLKYVADTTNYAIGAKGDLLVGTAADTLAAKSVGTDGYALHAQSGQTDGLQYLAPQAGFSLLNGYLDWTVSGNVLTVAIKGFDGNDPSATNPVFVMFRSATAANGGLTLRKLTAATTIAINDTATLGTSNSTAFRLWCVAFDDDGTVRLALINCLSTKNIHRLAGWGIASSTLEDNAADSAHVFYSSGAAVTSKAYATLGWASWESGLATAGTWSSAPTRMQLFGSAAPALPGQVLQVARTSVTAASSGTGVIPLDDTIPQNTEGDEYIASANFTPASAANLLDVELQAWMAHNSTSNHCTGALFRDATANAVAAGGFFSDTVDTQRFALTHKELAGSTSATSFKFRFGDNDVTVGTSSINGSAASGRRYGGVQESFIEIRELMV